MKAALNEREAEIVSQYYHVQEQGEMHHRRVFSDEKCRAACSCRPATALLYLASLREHLFQEIDLLFE